MKTGVEPRTLLTAELRRIHSLAQHLHCQGACFLQIAVLLVILLQQTLGTGIVCSHARSLPSAIVTAGVALVQLELPVRVIPRIDERHTEWSKTTVLGVSLLQIAQAANELLAGDLFIVGQEVALSRLTGVVYEDVRICGHSGDRTYHVAVIEG